MTAAEVLLHNPSFRCVIHTGAKDNLRCDMLVASLAYLWACNMACKNGYGFISENSTL